MSVLFAGGVNGSPADVTAYNANWDLLEGSLADRGSYLISGLAVSIGTGLAVNVALGVASIGGRVSVAGSFAIAGLAPSTTNHLFLLQNGTGTANTTGTQPALSAKLGTCATGVATVTSVSQARSSGCQQQVRTENLVPGGPGGGQPASINLAGWAAAAADSVTVYGVLPAGGLPADVAYIDAGNTFTVTQVFSPASGRCLTLNHKNTTGATVFLTSNNATDGTWRTLMSYAGKFQAGTDSTFSGTADWFMQNLSTGNTVLQCSAADLVTIGSAAAGGGAVLGKSGGKIAAFDGSPVVQQANASQAAITAVTDANAKSALQAIYNLLHSYNLAPATA